MNFGKYTWNRRSLGVIIRAHKLARRCKIKHLQFREHHVRLSAITELYIVTVRVYGIKGKRRVFFASKSQLGLFSRRRYNV